MTAQAEPTLLDWLGGALADNLLTFLALLVAGLSWWAAYRAARAADRSAEVALKQLALLTRRVEMIDDPGKMAQVLPAWFVQRMALDQWYFGLIMDSGIVFPISRISKISDDGRWLEVELLEKGEVNIHEFPNSPVAEMQLIYGLPGRTTANIQVSRIVGAMDLANT